MPLTYKPCTIKPFKPLELNHKTIGNKAYKPLDISHINHKRYAQLHSTKPELKFCGMSEIRDGENL